MNSQIFYEITTHLENPKDCLSYACTSREYSEFWKESPSFDTNKEYFRVHPSSQKKMRFDPRELVVYDRILSCSSRFIRVTGLSVHSPLLYFYCTSIAAQKELCCFLTQYKYPYFEKDNPYLIYGGPPASEVHSVYSSLDATTTIFYNPKKENSSPSYIEADIDVDIEYSKPAIEVIGIIYDTKNQLEDCYSLVEESCENPRTLKRIQDASMYTSEVIITEEREFDAVCNEHCRVPKLTIWYVTQSISSVYNICMSKELLETFYSFFGKHKPSVDHEAYLDEGMYPEEIVYKMHHVPPFLAKAWYVGCGYSEEKILSIHPRRKKVQTKEIQVVGVLKPDTAKYDIRIEPKSIFDRIPPRLRESIYSLQVHIGDREDVCELYRLYTGKSSISPGSAVKFVKDYLREDYERHKEEILQGDLLSILRRLQ